MTAAPPSARPGIGRLPAVLVVLMALVVARAIDDAAWVNGRGEPTDALWWCALLGALAGLAGPALGLARWRTHLAGALVAALAVPVLAGLAFAPRTPDGVAPDGGLVALPGAVADAYGRAAAGTVRAWLDVTVRGQRFTPEEIHYVVTLGLVVWATAQFAGFAAAGHRRPLAAALVPGLLLLGNMALTPLDQRWLLLVYVAAALVLVAAMRAAEEREERVARGFDEAAAGRGLRATTAAVVAVVLVSSVLAERAASAPLAGAWAGLDRRLVEAGEALARFLPSGVDVRGTPGVGFGDAAPIVGRWVTDDRVAFAAELPAGAPRDLYWRAATYDLVRSGGWQQGPGPVGSVASGDPLLDGTLEDEAPRLTDALSVTVLPDSYGDRSIVAPGLPALLSVDARVASTGEGGWLAGVEAADAPGAYRVTALVRRAGGDGVTGNLLRAAPEEYPAGVTLRYTEVPAGVAGSEALALLDLARSRAASDDPYDLAVALERLLRSDLFTYDADVRDLPCGDLGSVECFVRYRQGYCLHYASTMAVLLRLANPSNPIPTRLVQGFLPGEREDGREVVRNSAAHAWVEVYFPGAGWQAFDPTGGSVARSGPLPDGPSVTAPPPSPSGGAPAPTRRLEDPEATAPAGEGTVPPPAAPGGTTLAGALLLLAGVLLAAGILLARARRAARDLTAEGAWSGLTGLARRLGAGPRPAQTVYEYAVTLGELLPAARPDLSVVATAKVEAAYGRAVLDGSRLAALRAATGRVRRRLLGLLVRRLRR